MPNDAAHQEASLEASRCPICGYLLEVSLTKRNWEALKGFIPYNTARQLGSLAY